MDGLVPASKRRRVAAAIIDLIDLPIVLGVAIGLLMLGAPDVVRSIVLVIVNIIWLVFRDAVFSPARWMIDTKLVSITGEKVTIWQALIRNILLIIPFVLVLGYLIEIVMLLVKGHRLADSWAKTQVVEA